MTKYTQTQLENLVHRLRLVGAYDAIAEIERLREMIADFIHSWRWYQEYEYDREQPHDTIGVMIDYMENLGYKINHLGISRAKRVD